MAAILKFSQTYRAGLVHVTDLQLRCPLTSSSDKKDNESIEAPKRLNNIIFVANFGSILICFKLRITAKVVAKNSIAIIVLLLNMM